jgi:hypothetical protein
MKTSHWDHEEESETDIGKQEAIIDSNILLLLKELLKRRRHMMIKKKVWRFYSESAETERALKRIES